jgi:mRNA interferase RelE/StbE
VKYTIIIEKKAQKEAENIPIKIRTDIDNKILALAQNPRPYGFKKLTEKEGYRIRSGNYRILYTIDETIKTVVIYRIKIKGKTTYKL